MCAELRLTDHRHRIRLMLAGVLVLGSIAVPSHADPSCRLLPGGVTAWWPGDGIAGDVTLAGNDGQLIGGTTYAPGAVGLGFAFDGIDDRVDAADAPDLRPQRFTLAAWVRVDAIHEQSCIICKQYGVEGVDSYALWIDRGLLRGGLPGIEATDDEVVPLGRLVHAAMSWDGATLRLYLDGQPVAWTIGPSGSIPYDDNPVILGADDNGMEVYTAHLDGIIDEAQVFDRALSDCEIRALARSRPLGNCKGDTDGDLLPDSQDDCPWIANADQADADADGAGDACDCAPADPHLLAEPGPLDDVSFLSGNVVDWCGEPLRSGSSTVYDIVRGNLDELPVSGGSGECRSRCTDPLPGLVGWWPGDDDASDLVAGNDGTPELGAGYCPGEVGRAFDLDGNDDRIRTGDLTLGATFSVAAWVRPSIIGQGLYRRIAETWYAGGFYLGTDDTDSGYKFIVNHGTPPFGNAEGGTIRTGDWQLVVGTYDGTTGALYVDGVAVAQDDFPTPGDVTLPLTIGDFPGGGYGWAGAIDEVQIYGRALAAEEVVVLYEAGSAGQCKAGLGGTDAEWSAPWAADGTDPAAGRGMWYVLRGRNACDGGSYGAASDGTLRSPLACD